MEYLLALTRPREYFSETEGLLREGTLVFIGYFLTAMLLIIATLEWILGSLANPPTGLHNEVYGQFVPISLFMLLTMAIAWLVVGAIMHFIGGFETDGYFSHALGLAGWAYAPEIITTPLRGGIIWWELNNVTVFGSDPATVAREVEYYQVGAANALDILLFLVVTIWSVYILANGIQSTHDADFSMAWIAAIIVGVGSLVLFLAGLQGA